MPDDVAKRLTGTRAPYATMPARVRTWIDEQLGSPVVSVIPRTGGMSPAVASTLVTASGTRAFVKAVSSDINPDTPSHFRHEIEVLQTIGPAAYRADLLASYDDGHWVAILLEDVDGDHPDWDDATAVDAVFAVVMEQVAELTPIPPTIRTDSVADIMTKHQALILADPPAELFAVLPAWTRTSYAELMSFVTGGGPVDGDTLCHWDVRHDNLLVRERDEQVVMLDWGVSRRGPWWADVFVMGVEWAELDLFDQLLSRADLSDDEQRDATRLLASFGCYLLMSSALPAPPGLPQLPAFRADVGARCLAGTRRRLPL